MTSIIHISDLHFGCHLPVITDALLQTLNMINPELIIISGDLTQRAKHKEFRSAANFLSKLKQPYMIIPGNHDMSVYNVFERLFYPWNKWKQHIDNDLEPIVRSDAFTAVGVNTARRMGLQIDWSRGRINDHQIQHVTNTLDKTPSHHLKIVVAHHPFWLPQNYRDRGLVGKSDAALQKFKQSQVDLILGGHIHLAYVQLFDGVIISHAGTALSHRLLKNQPNSFNLIQGNNKMLKIEKWEWCKNTFKKITKKSFRKTKNNGFKNNITKYSKK